MLLKGDGLSLSLVRETAADPARSWVRALHFAILDGNGTVVGACDLRLGHNRNTYFGGNIGYRVEEPYRGHHYACRACRLLFDLARQEGMAHLVITCRPDNLPSRRTCERLGGELLEIAELPEDNDMRINEGMERVCVFRYDLGVSSVQYSERPLTGALTAQLLALSRNWEAENSVYGYRANEKEDLEGRRFFVAEADGAVVGYLFGRKFVSENMRSIMPEATPCFEIEELYVVPDRRSQGVGAALFHLAEDAVKAEADYLLLSAVSRNARALLHFYVDEVGMEIWSARLFRRIR